MILRNKKKLTPLRVVIGIVTLKWLFQGLILLYKNTLSRAIGKSCIYYPTCSSYMYQAIEDWGTIPGIVMGTARILRCNPLAAGGYDPVPYNPKGDMKWLY